jgi:hypothetical protein
MSVRENILQATRGFVKAALGYPIMGVDEEGNPVVQDTGDSHVIVAGDSGPQPSYPFITVHVLAPGIQTGTDELMYDLDEDGNMREWVRGHRKATVSLGGYGTDSAELLEQVRLSMEAPQVKASLDSYGVGVARVLSPPRYLFGLQDTGFEERSVMDLEVTFRLETAKVFITIANTVETGIVLDTKNPPADLTVTVTLVQQTIWDDGNTVWDDGITWDEGVVE